ncbi:MAG TPA: hypothetical protein VEX65_06920, partial [Flavisolibacter sp.]|nr:hypothetical protein [Flavisolibacter sp.]
MSLGALLLPDLLFGTPVDPAQFLNETMDTAAKKALADNALQAARSRGASFADVRIGRYLQQFISTRENRVQGIANNQSY